MTIHEAQQQLTIRLYELYPDREARNIADLVMEKLTGWSRIDRVMNKKLPLRPDQVTAVQSYGDQLLQHRPVQYVLNEAWFANMCLYVDEEVLIPRPETEELVEWIVSDKQKFPKEGKILDIGTGSGCIALALKKKYPDAEVHAIDVSEGALRVAQKNASTFSLDVHFHLFDILSADRFPLDHFDCIVSNPPYIPLRDKESMRDNVLKFEPWLALFVENDDPLCFYKAIAAFGQRHLQAGGSLYFEIHEEAASPVCHLLKEYQYREIQVKQDMQGKDRMISAVM